MLELIQYELGRWCQVGLGTDGSIGIIPLVFMRGEKGIWENSGVEDAMERAHVTYMVLSSILALTSIAYMEILSLICLLSLLVHVLHGGLRQCVVLPHGLLLYYRSHVLYDCDQFSILARPCPTASGTG